MAPALPARAAFISAVSPSGRALLASAPALSSASTSTGSPFWAARMIGVTP